VSLHVIKFKLFFLDGKSNGGLLFVKADIGHKTTQKGHALIISDIHRQIPN
jgi:hypothetical protein